ncbi:hypothetical protein K2173_023850 [Erythroxylum novogranatense]|uniref:TLC domain-containing protein n=1 Tax=Erythroxylum novogranatense TaxID=1862640 RepID=A0AAV8TSC1_9ROSI|nr:hypothetical protein K2173_023850 [Erythroxylum novogranatense]
MDLLHYLIFYPSDILFVEHHLATLFIFLTCRYLVTKGCRKAWALANAQRMDNEFAAKVFDVLSPPFYAFYSVIRGFLGPYFVYQMGSSYISGVAEGVIPKWVWVSWLIVVTLAISVSILWVLNLWAQLYREKSAKLAKKLT